MRIRSSAVVLGLLAATCCAEAIANRHVDVSLAYNLHTGTFPNNRSWPSGYQFDDDISRSRIHAEGWGLLKVSYQLAGSVEQHAAIRPTLDYHPPDPYRMLSPFLVSLALPFVAYPVACFVTNLGIWIAATWSTWWLARRALGSDRAAAIAGLLAATSCAFFVLLSANKAEILQLGGYFVLVAAAVALGLFDAPPAPDLRPRLVALGAALGLGLFASGASLYAVAFLCTYAVMRLRLAVAIARLAATGVVAMAVFWLVSKSFVVDRTTPLNWVGYGDLNLAAAIPAWAACSARRFAGHFVTSVPPTLWVLAGLGFRVMGKEARMLALSMASSVLVSEALMIGASGKECLYWAPGYYYLQVLLPTFLAAACAVEWGLTPGGGLAGKVRRVVVVGFLAVTIALSNRSLLGNDYYVIAAFRPVPLEYLLRSFGTVGNLDLYPAN